MHRGLSYGSWTPEQRKQFRNALERASDLTDLYPMGYKIKIHLLPDDHPARMSGYMPGDVLHAALEETIDLRKTVDEE